VISTPGACEASRRRSARIAGEHGVTAAGGARKNACIDDVMDLRLGTELASVFGECFIEWLDDAGVHDLSESGLASSASGLGKRRCGNAGDDLTSDRFAPERPEGSLVLLSCDQRAGIEREPGQRDLALARPAR
jgi:hypothetical protein